MNQPAPSTRRHRSGNHDLPLHGRGPSVLLGPPAFFSDCATTTETGRRTITKICQDAPPGRAGFLTPQAKGRAMKGSCQKCGGLLVIERVLDYYGPLAGVKCVNCGWFRRKAPSSHSSTSGMAARGAHQ